MKSTLSIIKLQQFQHWTFHYEKIATQDLNNNNIPSITKFWIDSSSNCNRVECLPLNNIEDNENMKIERVTYIKALQEEFPILLRHSCFLHPLALELYTFCTDNKQWDWRTPHYKLICLHQWLKSKHFQVEKDKRTIQK